MSSGHSACEPAHHTSRQPRRKAHERRPRLESVKHGTHTATVMAAARRATANEGLEAQVKVLTELVEKQAALLAQQQLLTSQQQQQQEHPSRAVPVLTTWKSLSKSDKNSVKVWCFALRVTCFS